MSNVMDFTGLTLNCAHVNAGNISTLEAAATATAVSLAIPTYAVSGVPDASENDGRFIFVTDGDAGAPCLAVSDGSNWDVAFGANAGTPVATE